MDPTPRTRRKILVQICACGQLGTHQKEKFIGSNYSTKTNINRKKSWKTPPHEKPPPSRPSGFGKNSIFFHLFFMHKGKSFEKTVQNGQHEIFPTHWQPKLTHPQLFIKSFCNYRIGWAWKGRWEQETTTKIVRILLTLVPSPRTRPTNTCKISAVGRLGTHQKEQIGGPNYSAKINIPEFHKYKTGFEKKKFTKIPKTGLIFTKKNGLIFMKFGYVI